MKSLLRICLSGACTILLSAPGWAACNDPNDWMMSPRAGVKWVVDNANEVAGVAGMTEVMDGLNVKVSPFPLTPELAKKIGKGPLSLDKKYDSDEAYILYYEPTSTGGWRLCRSEEWWFMTGPSGKLNQKIRTGRQKYIDAAKANPLISTLTEGWKVHAADVLLYNVKGQLTETFRTYLHPETDQIVRFETRCARYDEQGHQTLFDVPVNNICPTGRPGLMDRYRIFEFGLFKQKIVTNRTTYHEGSLEENGWSEDIDSLDPPFWAIQDSWHGLTRFQTSHNFLQLDLSERNARRATAHPEFFDPIQYYFPNNKVFLSDIEPDFSRIYQYDRRREVTDQGHAWDLQEFFKANSHIPSYRFQVVRGRTQRQEQLDAQGHVTRIIDVGRREQPQFPDEAIQVPRKLKGHEIYYRVWDVDANGKKTLVGLGWNASLRPWFGAGEDHDTLDTARVIYGVPDGTAKWNDDQFAEHFGYDEDATPVWKGKQKDEGH